MSSPLRGIVVGTDTRCGCRAPVLFVKGRQHPVKILYSAEPVKDYIDAALKTIFQCHMQRPPGDILVFLPGPLFPRALRAFELTPSTAGQDDIESLAASIKSYLPDLAKTHPTTSSVRSLPHPLHSPQSPPLNSFIAAPHLPPLRTPLAQ